MTHEGAVVTDGDRMSGGRPAPLVIGIAMSMILGACATPPQTLRYMNPQEPALYTAKQQALKDAPNGSSGQAVKNDWKFYEAQGDQAMDHGMIHEAATAYQRALALNLEKGSIHNKLGRVMLKQGDWDQAIGHFNLARQIDPADSSASEGLGLAYLNQSEDKKAKDAFEVSLESNPDIAAPYNGLGIMYDREGVHGLAGVFFETALLLEPQNAHYHNNLGYSLLLSGELDKAIASLETAVRLDPAFRKAHNNLGYAYGLKGDFDRAFEEFRLATDEAGAYNNVGYLYSRIGKYQQALASFQKAIEKKPSWYVKADQNLQAVGTKRGELQNQ